MKATTRPTHVAATTISSAEQISTSSSRQLGVLGIALIMEEAGKGARLVFRYPASPPPIFLHTSPSSMKRFASDVHYNNNSTKAAKNKKDVDVGSSSNKGKSSDLRANSSSGGGGGGSIDLFFDLPARVLSKLFRPKKALCRQPLTLNVSGTTFCCRAELFDSQPSTIGEGHQHPLVLFSIIVALAPLAPKEKSSLDHMQFDALYSVNNSHTTTTSQLRSDAAFLTITAVHRNLARLCRVLTREELRSRYVSRQCHMLLDIRKEYERSHGSECAHSDGGTEANKSATTSSVGDANVKKGESTAGPPLSPKDKRTIIPSSNTKAKEQKKSNMWSPLDRRHYVQNLIEILLSASPPTDKDTNDLDEGVELHGNLAQELANVFHWISSPLVTPGSLSREGIVYINRHVAVPLESVLLVGGRQQTTGGQKQHPIIDPSHTLLFPNMSASEILESLMDETIEMSAANLSTAQTLRRILPHIQPRKAVSEIAIDAGISLQYAMNATSWLLQSGIGVSAMPVLRKNRYVCADDIVERMSSMAGKFWQTFGVMCSSMSFHWGIRNELAVGGVPYIYAIVSALTSTTKDGRSVSTPPTLDEAITKIPKANQEVMYKMAVWLIANKLLLRKAN